MEMRKFNKGATRDTEQGKYEYYGFTHPLLDYCFARYMHKNRTMGDGSLRDSNNWWGGFGKDVVIQSMTRHVEDLKLLHTGYKVYEVRENGECRREVLTQKEKPKKHWKEITIEDCCNAIRFNSQAYLLEIIKGAKR